jgi:hypothetical protein
MRLRSFAAAFVLILGSAACAPDADTGEPEDTAEGAASAASPFDAAENKALLPALLAGSGATRSLEAASWRTAFVASDRKHLAAILPPTTPITVGLANLKAFPIAKVNVAKLRAFADAGQLAGFVMYDGGRAFKRAVPASGAEVKLVAGFGRPDLPVRTQISNVGAAGVELRITNTGEISTFTTDVVDAGQFAMRVVAVPYTPEGATEPTHLLVYTVGGGNLKGYKKEFTGLVEDLTRWLTDSLKR